MRLLLDTHTLLWWLTDDPGLAPPARRAISVEAWVGVSAATVWELSIKRALGKLEAPDDLPGAIVASGFHPVSITVQHADGAGALPRHHDDPFDRMLVAQALAEDLTIVTRDPRMQLYEVKVLAA